MHRAHHARQDRAVANPRIEQPHCGRSRVDACEFQTDTLRNDPNLAELPVVIISDTPEEADKSLRARDVKNVFLIPKPFTGAQVARALTELLGSSG